MKNKVMVQKRSFYNTRPVSRQANKGDDQAFSYSTWCMSKDKSCTMVNRNETKRSHRKMFSIAMAAIIIQRNLRKYLSRQHESSKAAAIIKLKYHLSSDNRPYMTTREKRETLRKANQNNGKDIWQARAIKVMRRAKIFACIRKSVDIDSILDECGTVINCTDYKGNTPLYCAAKKRKISMCEKIIENGADINAKNEYGNTALHFAIMEELTELAAVLLKYGADIYAKNDKGKTPLMLAKGWMLKKLKLDNLPLNVE